MLKRKDNILLFLLSLFLIFPNASFNFWNIFDNEKFKGFEFVSESLVIGRLMRIESEGILVDQMRLGRYFDDNSGEYINHHRAFFDKLYSRDYKQYDSQMGLQGVVWGLMDVLLRMFEISPKYRLGIYRCIASLLFSATISYVLVFFYNEFGLLAYFSSLLTSLFFENLMIFGKNLYWMIFLLNLPMIIGLYFHRIEEEKGEFCNKLYLIIISALIFFKSSCGYEYISTLMTSTLIPIVYFAIKNSWGAKRILSRSIETAVACLCGFLSSILFHIFQLSVAYGGVVQAVEVLWGRIAERTHFSQIAPLSNIMDVIAVFKLYLIQPVFSSGMFINVLYMHVLLIFIFFVFLGNTHSYFRRINNKKFLGLSACFGLSLIATFSWYILAKGHSLNHAHLNSVLWHTPLTFFGLALVSYFFSCLFKERTNELAANL